jgi:hypothetical protein
MIWEGLIDEALQVARGARDRYNGIKRNPWNEIECGDHYARAMSSWTILLALEGFSYDGPQGVIGFNPRYAPDDFRAFFTAAEGWGTFTQKREKGEAGFLAPPVRRQTATFEVKYGRLTLKELVLTLPERSGSPKSVGLLVSGAPVKATSETKGGLLHIALDEPVTFADRQQIQAVIEW